MVLELAVLIDEILLNFLEKVMAAGHVSQVPLQDAAGEHFALGHKIDAPVSDRLL